MRCASSLNTSMKTWPMILPLLLRVGDAGQGRQEAVAGVDDVQVGLEVVAERAAHRLGLALAQQAVVDEDARDLRADGPEQQRRRHRRIDAAGQAADDAVRCRSAARSSATVCSMNDCHLPQCPGSRRPRRGSCAGSGRRTACG